MTRHFRHDESSIIAANENESELSAELDISNADTLCFDEPPEFPQSDTESYKRGPE